MNHRIEADISVLADQPIHIAVVSSQFNQTICQRLQDGAMRFWQDHHTTDKHELSLITVPGAVEIPQMINHLAAKGCYDAIIALGAVIKGQTDHYHWVGEQASQGCQQAALAHDVPVIFGVLTTENEELAMARTGGDHSDAGLEAMQAAFDVLSVRNQLKQA